MMIKSHHNTDSIIPFSLFIKWMSPLTSHHILLSMSRSYLWPLYPIPYIPYISFERLAPNVSHVNTRSSYTRVQWYHDISNAICGCIVIPILYTKDNELPWSFSHTLRVICIFLYFLCTYNHIEYCITCNNLDKMFPLLLLFTLTSFNVVFIAIVIHYTSLTQYLIKVSDYTVLFCYPCIKHSNAAWPMTYHMSIIVALSTGLYVLALPFVH